MFFFWLIFFILFKPLQETALAIASFQTNEEGRLSFDLGQIIYIRKKGDKGWYQGEIRVWEMNFFVFIFIHIYFLKTADQPIRVGWFPANCVQLQTVSSPTTPVASYQNTPGIR